MKQYKKQTKYICIVLCLLVAAAIICAVILHNMNDGKAEYMLICSYNFNDSDDIPAGISTDSYSEGAEFYYSKTEGMDGSGCIVIHSNEENDARFTYKYDNALKKTYYRMSVWVKTVGVSDTSASADNKPVGANISVMNTYNHSEAYTGDTDWTYIEYYGRTADNQKSFTVALRLGFYGGTNKGTVYFDDFMLEQLDSLPEGAVSHTIGDTVTKTANAEAQSQHSDTMLAASLMLICLIIYLIIAARYAYIREREAHNIDQHNLLDLICENSSPVNYINSVLVLIGIGLAVRIVMSFTMPQCDIDVNLFQYWGNNLYAKGIPDFYANAEAMNLDYPPLFMYFLYILGAVGKIFNITQTVGFDVLLKLPSIAADCVIAYIIYKIAYRRMSKNWTLFIMALWLFNPVVLLDSACWGQVDSILSLALLLAAYYIETERYGYSAAALAFAVTLKPQGIFFVPILGFALIRQLIYDKNVPSAKRMLRFAYSICSFFITAFVIVLPFGYKEGFGIFKWIINLYTNTANGYTRATVNAFNFFYMLGANWVEDSTKFMGLTYFIWGMIAIVIICLIVGALYIFGRNKKSSDVYLYSGILIYAVSVFGPRMHERYFYPAIVLLLAALIYFNNKALLGIYATVSISNFYTVLEVMTGLSIGGKFIDTDYATASYYYWPPLNNERTAMCVVNVLGAVLLMAFAVMAALYSQNIDNDYLRIWGKHDHKPNKVNSGYDNSGNATVIQNKNELYDYNETITYSRTDNSIENNNNNDETEPGGYNA